MNSAKPPDQGTPSDDFDEHLARQIVMDGFDRYLTRERERIDPFVDEHFSFSGTLKLHRHAVGWDMLRAPANVAAAVPQFWLMAGSKLARRAGWERGANWMGERQIVMETAVAQEIEWLVHTELLQLPYRRGARESTRDALTEAVFADPRIETVSRLVLEAIGRHTNDPEYRRNLERKLADYTRSREAAAEITAAIISAAVGAIAFNQMTPGVMSLGPAAAGAAAQSAAIAGFPWAPPWVASGTACFRRVQEWRRRRPSPAHSRSRWHRSAHSPESLPTPHSAASVCTSDASAS